ncbi:50S ribosomal protein L32, partial [Patescibacteria group bacterium]|nr:50S ribosomal protein L32 [Patescibacteria group bacterium]
GKAVKPHTACAFCGTYRGRQVLKAKTTSVKSK